MHETRKYNPYKPGIFGYEHWASPACKRYEKTRRHRVFRRLAKRAIWRELKGDDDVSHNFYFGGDWLM